MIQVTGFFYLFLQICPTTFQNLTPMKEKVSMKFISTRQLNKSAQPRFGILNTRLGKGAGKRGSPITKEV